MKKITFVGLLFFIVIEGFPHGLVGKVGKESGYNVGDLVSIHGWEDPLEKGMKTHFNIHAWRMTQEPVGYSYSPLHFHFQVKDEVIR